MKRKLTSYICAVVIAFTSILPTTNANSTIKSLKDNPYKYSGYYSDSESDMYYLKARYYSPEVGRFINRDTYDLSNRYAYGDADPIGKTDPSGHFAVGEFFMSFIPGYGTYKAFKDSSTWQVKTGCIVMDLVLIGSIGDILHSILITKSQYIKIFGKKLGAGFDGTVYKYWNTAYKVYKKRISTERLRRMVEKINNIPANINAGFVAEVSNDMISMPIARQITEEEMGIRSREIEQVLYDMAFKRLMGIGDANYTNFLDYNGNIVIADVGRVWNQSYSRGISFDSRKILNGIKDKIISADDMDKIDINDLHPDTIMKGLYY